MSERRCTFQHSPYYSCPTAWIPCVHSPLLPKCDYLSNLNGETTYLWKFFYGFHGMICRASFCLALFLFRLILKCILQLTPKSGHSSWQSPSALLFGTCASAFPSPTMVFKQLLLWKCAELTVVTALQICIVCSFF